MSSTTGFADTFNRTVANGLGTADDGQVYALNGVATQFSVDPGNKTGNIAIASTGDKYGYVDAHTSDVDIVGGVSMNGVPASNLTTVGFVAKMSSTSNYYSGTMMVATGGGISLRFSKVIGGGLTTIATVATGLTYAAFDEYNLRYLIFWSRARQTNVMLLKLWLAGTLEPGGWMATATDAALTNYTAGTQIGIYGRDESTVSGTMAVYHFGYSIRSYALPIPTSTDPMCYDPAIAYPKQTALESLADAADAAMATLDPLTSLAGLFPRVRVSNSTLSISTVPVSITVPFAATEFNVGTPTNLGYDSTSVYLGVGIWMLTFEMQLAEATSDQILVNFSTPDSASGLVFVDMRSSPNHANDQGVGGTIHASKIAFSTDPTTPVKYAVVLSPSNTNTTYVATYVALSAIKISDYFA